MTVLLDDQDDERKTTQPDSIRITAVTALEYPSAGYEYRGLIRSLDEAGGLLTEQILQIRYNPDWLVNMTHRGYGLWLVTLQCRPPGTPAWQDIGRAVFDPRAYPAGESSTVVDVPVLGWNETPQLWIQLRLSAVGRVARPDVGNEPIPQPPDSPAPGWAAQPGMGGVGPNAGETPGWAADLPYEETIALTAPEIVIVKDVWNKFLAYQDMLMEMFFERLLHEEPDLVHGFGEAVDLAPRYFAELFDVSIRALNPHTERPLREAHQGIYPPLPDGLQSVSDYAGLLADLGMTPGHWITARRIWVWTLSQIPHLEDYDRENLGKGVHSALYRFFTRAVLVPAVAVANQYAEALTPAMIREMRRCGDIMAADSLATGVDFYRTLFQQHPDVLPYFGRTDVDALAMHLMRTVAFLVQSLEAGRDAAHELRDLGRRHAQAGVPPDAYAKITEPMLTVMKQYIPDFTPELERAWTILLNRVSNVLKQPMVNQQRLLTQAREFVELIAGELAWEPADRDRRWHEIDREIQATGTYTQTYEELAYGAQLAWRNAGKCIGRIAWRNMIVRDLRQVTDPDEMFRECAEHLRMGTNGGNMQAVINVFRPKKPLERWGPRIWNSQYIRFAAYEQEDGTVLGDKANQALTQALLRLGWTPPSPKTAFDTLPLVIEVPGQAPRMYTFAPEDVLTVALRHPLHPDFDALGLRWCAIPAIANFRLEIGGIQYGCIPFNGWFMETEIARNLWEDGRYGQAEAIARSFGLDTASEQTLWRDRAFLELNVAVLHSFSRAKVTLVDHQTASRQFLSHDLREKRAGRECPAQWSWVVPSAGGSTTPVWHHEMRDFFLSPSYHYAADKWAVIDTELVIPGETLTAAVPPRKQIVILYGSETGTAESYAHQTARRLSRHQPRVMALDEYNPAELGQESFVLVIASTFADGDLPGNAKKFYAWIREQPSRSFEGLNFSVMALGSTIYPDFCAAGIALDRELVRIGGHRVVSMHKGDEIKGQAGTFRQWLDLMARLLGEDPTTAAEAATNRPRLAVSFLTDEQVMAVPGDTQTRPRPGVVVPVLANRELLKDGVAGGRSTRFLAFDISGTEVVYETGDHVALYPHNPAGLVERLCTRLGVDPAARFTTVFVDPSGAVGPASPPCADPVRVGQFLTEDVDLALPEPVNELVELLAGTAVGAADRERLDIWLATLGRGEEDAACLALKKSIADQFMTVADLLDAFPSAGVGLAHLIDLLPRQKPRLYSISSSPLVYPGQIHALIGVVQITTDAGLTRVGLCSGYLAGLDPEQGATVRLAVRTSSFHPPLDPLAPLLMVGPGTGLAPLIGFLQQREVQLQALGAAAREPHGKAVAAEGVLSGRMGDTRLYFGCRNLNDYLYQQELETWHRTGVLTRLEVAFSRLGEERVYVQHLMSQHREQLWEMLAQPNCHYYVCGDARMADEVFDVLMKIAQTTGGLSYADAIRFFWKMQDEKRLIMDVWGVLLNFRQSLADVQEDRYTQGERWLERLTQS